MIAILKKSLCWTCVLAAWGTAARAVELKSPDGRLAITFDVTDMSDIEGCAVYSVSRRGKAIVSRSRLGLELEGGPLVDGLEIVGQTTDRHDGTWKPVYGQWSTVGDNYRQLAVELREADAPHRKLLLTFRAYNEGVAFCYTIPKQPAMQSVSIAQEKSEFCFPADHMAWPVYSAQGRYAKVRLSRIKPGCERPLVIEADDDTYVALAEARLVDYARMKFAPLSGRPHAVVSSLSGPVEAELPLKTPWRVIMVAESPGQLLENSHVILSLNDACAIDDTSWIKPGKVIREVTLTTTGGKACIDFAAEHNLQYVEFDAGWYGHEYSEESDATTVAVDPKRSPGPLDLPEVIRYADQHGIGILLYVNRRALERQLDAILPLFQRWGIKGVKYGFVNVGSQQWTSWLHEAVRKAARHRLMVDVHDEYRPTGYSRTYPNLMTQEGIGGDETSPSNEQTLMILFTRMLAGAGDNTICYYNERVQRNANHAYQLAKAVCLYSPWQFLYWYDRPGTSPGKKGGAGGGQNNIGNEPELAFFDAVPTVWDEMRVIHGRIGECAAIARRSGENWFVGCMNAAGPRTLDVPLDFLDPARQYVAEVYAHDPAVATRTHVKIDRIGVDATTVLKVDLSDNDGQAMRIIPAVRPAASASSDNT